MAKVSALEPNNYPVNLVVRDRRCLVVGGGAVALRKVRGLLAADALVTVVAPEIRPELRQLEHERGVRLHVRPYEHGEVAGYRLVITCTDDRQVNEQVYRDAEAAGVWANSADDPVNCAFTLPAVARQGHLQVTVSTAGRSPALARWLRKRFETEFDERWIELLDVLAEVRAEAREVLGTSEITGWDDALDDGLFDLVAAGRRDAAVDRLRGHLGLPAPAGARR